MASATGRFTALRRKREVNIQLWIKSITIPTIGTIYVVETVWQLLQTLFYKSELLEFSASKTSITELKII